MNAALAIKDAIVKIQKRYGGVVGASASATTSVFVGKYQHIKGQYWAEIFSDGTARHGFGFLGKWKVENGRLTVEWSNGVVETLEQPTADGNFRGTGKGGSKWTVRKLPSN